MKQEDRALKAALPFVEEFGNAWLEGSVSAKTALIGVMTRAMLAFATSAPVIETEGSACDVCGGTGRNNSDQLWPGRFPCRYCSGSGKEDARESRNCGEREQDVLQPCAIGRRKAAP